jgi:hypothetical protein
MIRPSFVALVVAALVTSGVYAVNPVQWEVQRTLTKPAAQDAVSSPTAIDLGLAAYRVSYSVRELSSITALGPIDLRGPLETRVRGEQIVTTFPVVMLNEVASENVTNSQVRLNLSVDAQGRPQVAWSNAVYGVLQVGPSSFPVESIRTLLDFDVIGYQFGDYSLNTRFGLGDFQMWQSDFGTNTTRADGNRNGTIDAADFTVWRDQVTSNFGDLNLDGSVNGADYTLWQNSFAGPTVLAADANENEAIDAADYTVWRDRLFFATEAAVPAAVPEPAALAINAAVFGLGAAFSLDARARRLARSRS